MLQPSLSRSLCSLLWGGSLFISSLSTVSWAETPSPSSLAAALQPFVERHEVAGAVMLVAGPERLIACETAGFSDVAHQTVMPKDALFWIASMTKAMTAAAVMILVDEGKISMDDPVEKYLPEFKNQWVISEKNDEQILLKRPKQKVLLRHLLSHTSGLAFRSQVETPTLDRWTLELGALSYASEPLLHEPESKYLYSNEGINAAGRVIEVVSGQSYEEFMQKRLFDPLGMKDTTFWPTEEQLKRLAKPYKPNASKDNLEETKISQLQYPLSDRKRQPMPGGGLFSTAEDVMRFCQMLLKGGEFAGQKILSQDSVTQMTTRRTPEHLKESYGYGLTVSPINYGHGGALSTNMMIWPQYQLITVYLVQHAGFPGNGGKGLESFHQAVRQIYGHKAALSR